MKSKILISLTILGVFVACKFPQTRQELVEQITGCPPYQEEVAFSSHKAVAVAQPTEDIPPDYLDKMYKRVQDDFEDSGIELEKMANGFKAKGITLSKVSGPDGQTRELLVSLDGDIAFATGSHKLTPKAEELVDKITAAMKDYPNTLSKIGGHTDSVGRFSSNMALSRRRAGSVKSRLISKGVASRRILEAKGYADTQKIVDTKKAEVRNRRVEIKVIPGKV